MSNSLADTSSTRQFLGYIFDPRYPTWDDEEAISENFEGTRLVENPDFWVMGKPTDYYHCFEWAIQRPDWPGHELDDRKDFQKLTQLFDMLGSEPSNEAQADIDIYRYTYGNGNVASIAHFSLKTEYGWTSKLGSGLLIVHHDRYALLESDEVEDEDYDNSAYGDVIGHFKRKANIPAQQPSIVEICDQAKCDHAECDDVDFFHNGCNLDRRDDTDDDNDSDDTDNDDAEDDDVNNVNTDGVGINKSQD